MRLRNLAFKWKLVLVIMLVCVPTLLVACALFFSYEYTETRTLIERDLTTIATVSAANSTAALSFEDPEAAAETLAALSAKPTIEAACLYGKDGRVFAYYFRGGLKIELPHIPGEDGFTSSNGQLKLFLPVTLKNERIGTIYVCSNFSQLDSWIKAFLLMAAGILLLTAILALGLASILQRPILAPVVALSETARQVSEKQDYALRAEKRGNDELGYLVDRFNEMLAQIQARDLALALARQNLEKRVEERTMELQHANKELESFSYSVAHDLRAPLRSIDGFVNVFLEEFGQKIDPQGAHYLGRVRMASQRMGQLIDDMLSLSRVVRSNFTPRPIDLAELASAVGAELKHLNPDRQVEFVHPEKLPAMGDASFIRIALQNLLGNAWKFTGKVEKARIELGTTQINGSAAYFVRDNGAGFSMEYIDKLFGVFQRLHTASEFPGTGVGLATVQRIVNKHGGRIWAESEVGKGATFYFTLQH